MRKILLLFLLFNPYAAWAMDDAERQALLPHVTIQADNPHPPSYEESTFQSTSSCTNRKKACTTTLLGVCWIIGLLSQILPANELFQPETKEAAFAWWGTALGSQVALGIIALCGIWRR